MKKLKPVVFIQGDRDFYRDNKYNQNLLIKAMSEGITSPAELRDASGLKTIPDVYRTLDKLTLRKDYHDALVKNGVDLDFIVSGIKEITEKASKSATRLKGYEILLKSLGLDKYESAEDSGKNWEELIIEASENEKPKEEITQIKTDYEVIVPPTPSIDKKRQEDEKEVAEQLYAN